VTRDLITECLPEKDHYMAGAYLGLLSWAAREEKIIEAFEKDTGISLEIKGGIEGMIDKATGYQEDLVFKFAHWVTANLWGDSDE